MNTFFRFFYEFISVFFGGLFSAFKGLIDGIIKMFSINEYSKILDSYKSHFNGNEKVFVIISVACLIIMLLLVAGLIYLFVKKLLRKASTRMSKEELLNEIGNLNDQVRQLMKEKDELMAMKVSQLGLNPDDEETDENNKGDSTETVGYSRQNKCSCR